MSRLVSYSRGTLLAGMIQLAASSRQLRACGTGRVKLANHTVRIDVCSFSCTLRIAENLHVAMYMLYTWHMQAWQLRSGLVWFGVSVSPGRGNSLASDCQRSTSPTISCGELSEV